MYIRGILAFLAGVILVMLLTASQNGDALIFFEPTVIVGFFFVIAGTLLATGNVKTFVSAVNALFSKKYRLTAAVRHEAVEVFKLLAVNIFIGMGLFVMIGLVILLSNLGDPGLYGARVAVAYLSLFYGLLLNMVFIYPAIYLLKNRRNTEEKILISDKEVVNKLLELCYKQGVSPETILEAEEIYFRSEDDYTPGNGN
jgi:flagellar motor component MotA